MSFSDLYGPLDLSIVDVSVAPEGKFMGCNPRDDRLGAMFPVSESEEDLIPRGEWDALIAEQADNESLVGEIKDQGQEGTCASNATTGAAEFVWNLEFGIDVWIQYSPISIYRWIAPNGNSGSTISDNLRQLRDVGPLPADTPRNRELLAKAGLPIKVLKNVGYGQQFPDGWQDVAAILRCMEWSDIASFDGMVSNILRKRTPVYGRAGHAIYGVKVVKRNGVYYIKYANSWRKTWGENGYGYDSESFISRSIASYGAFAPRAGYMPEFVKLLRAA